MVLALLLSSVLSVMSAPAQEANGAGAASKYLEEGYAYGPAINGFAWRLWRGRDRQGESEIYLGTFSQFEDISFVAALCNVTDHELVLKRTDFNLRLRVTDQAGQTREAAAQVEHEALEKKVNPGQQASSAIVQLQKVFGHLPPGVYTLNFGLPADAYTVALPGAVGPRPDFRPAELEALPMKFVIARVEF